MMRRKSGTKNPEVMPVHIGQLLSEKIKERRMSKAELARKINRPSSAIKPLLGRPSMQCYLLWELSIALEHNFFADLSAALPEKNANLKTTDTPVTVTLETLRNEMDEIKKILNVPKN